jgi:signal peptidase
MSLSSLRKIASALLVTVAAAVALLTIVPTLAGYQRYVILTGSMTGTYDPGSVVFDKPVPVRDLRVGDVITYAPPRGESPMPLVTHRIVSIKSARDGRPVFRTKGDANPTPDPWRFQLDQGTQPRVDFGVPYAGRALGALSDPHTRQILIGIPALLIALAIAGRLVADERRERRTPAEAGA